MAAIGLAWFVVSRDEPSSRDSSGMLVRLIPTLFVLCLSIAAGHQAIRVRRNSDELHRLRRQLSGLPAYLSPLPPTARNLLRAAMMPRLFPRLLEDDDLLRNQDWFPDGDHLLAAIDSELFIKLAETREENHDELRDEDGEDPASRDEPVDCDDAEDSNT